MDPSERPSPLLGADAPVPTDRPFTRTEATALGVPDRQLARWCASGELVHPIRGVYHAAQLPDDPALRLGCLKLVVPDDAVVTDRTAGWLHGAPMILAPNDHLSVPAVSMFRPPGYRLRNDLAASGERTLAEGEIVTIGGVRVTSRLRTTCDLGMMRGRDQAFGAMDMMMRIADFDRRALVAQGSRFRGYRRVRQFRALAPHVDARSQSPAESILRLRWLDLTSLPPPTPQLAVEGPDGVFYLDLGVEGLRYAAEYDGAQWHGPEQRAHDQRRRDWMRDHGDWLIDVFVDTNLFGPAQDVQTRLALGIAAARRRVGARAWHGQDRAS